MKLILILVMCYLWPIQIIDSNKYKIIFDDEVLPYTIEKGVSPLSEYISTEHLIFEQIDDDMVELGGYAECIKSLNPNLLLQLSIRTEFLDQSSWREGPLRITALDICPEATNPTRFWYNITKLWTCPPQNGDKLFVETQIIDMQLNLPPSIPIGKWRAHMLYTQGLLRKDSKLGFSLNMELIYV